MRSDANAVDMQSLIVGAFMAIRYFYNSENTKHAAYEPRYLNTVSQPQIETGVFWYCTQPCIIPRRLRPFSNFMNSHFLDIHPSPRVNLHPACDSESTLLQPTCLAVPCSEYPRSLCLGKEAKQTLTYHLRELSCCKQMGTPMVSAYQLLCESFNHFTKCNTASLGDNSKHGDSCQACTQNNGNQNRVGLWDTAVSASRGLVGTGTWRR
jgi:hypothetical protein